MESFLQVVCICWSTMRSTRSRCPVRTHAPSSPFPGWSWAAKSTSPAPNQATPQSSLSRRNPFMVANYTSKFLLLSTPVDVSLVKLVIFLHFLFCLQGHSGGEAQPHQRGGVSCAGGVERRLGVQLHQRRDEGGRRHQDARYQKARSTDREARTN